MQHSNVTQQRTSLWPKDCSLGNHKIERWEGNTILLFERPSQSVEQVSWKPALTTEIKLLGCFAHHLPGSWLENVHSASYFFIQATFLAFFLVCMLAGKLRETLALPNHWQNECLWQSMDLGSMGYGIYDLPAFIGLGQMRGSYNSLLPLWGALGETQVNQQKYAVSFRTV